MINGWGCNNGISFIYLMKNDKDNEWMQQKEWQRRASLVLHGCPGPPPATLGSELELQPCKYKLINYPLSELNANISRRRTLLQMKNFNSMRLVSTLYLWT